MRAHFALLWHASPGLYTPHGDLLLLHACLTAVAYTSLVCDFVSYRQPSPFSPFSGKFCPYLAACVTSHTGLPTPSRLPSPMPSGWHYHFTTPTTMLPRTWWDLFSLAATLGSFPPLPSTCGTIPVFPVGLCVVVAWQWDPHPWTRTRQCGTSSLSPYPHHPTTT